MNPDYDFQTVGDWMDDMSSGRLALTDFQRSRVWDPGRIARFLKAILLGRPTGTLLLVGSGAGFGRRPILDNGADIHNAASLILDGQQRLTSLWQGLTGKGDRRYYIRVADVEGYDFQVKGVGHRPTDYRRYQQPRDEFQNNVIPLGILYDSPDHDSKNPTRLERWCDETTPSESHRSSQLRRSIDHHFKKPLDKYKLWYARLDDICVDEAISIFVETNRASVKVTAFDLAVAQAVQISADIRLRDRIQRLRETSETIKHYFKTDREHWIPEIGECILKIACLKIEGGGRPPKNGHYGAALEHLFADGTTKAESVESDLVSALQLLEDMGVPNSDVLPRVPPVYVVAALQNEIEDVPQIHRAKAVRLVTRYLWRSFLSDRYESQANDRLYEDYTALCTDMQRIRAGGSPRADAPALSTASLVSRRQLLKPTATRSPIGNAIAALALDHGALDWVTGEKMTPARVRQLEREGRLDRHHVFTRKALVRGGLSGKDKLVNHALNIVLIPKLSNITLGSKEPGQYLKNLKQHDTGLTDRALRWRIESHLLPYDAVVSQGEPIKIRYKRYLKARADLLLETIDARTRLGP